MTESKPIQQALSQLLYSVVEKGICRIVTSQQPSTLPELQRAYTESLPAHHNVIWLSGKLDSIESLIGALIEAGVNELLQGFTMESYIELCQEYLIRQHDAGIIEVWAITDVDHLSPDIHALLSTLVEFNYINTPLLSIELWGDAQLDVFYQSGAVQEVYSCPLYPIRLGQKILINKTEKKRFYAAVAASLIIGAFAGVLLSNQLYSLVPNNEVVLDYQTQDDEANDNSGHNDKELNNQALSDSAYSQKTLYTSEQNTELRTTRVDIAEQSNAKTKPMAIIKSKKKLVSSVPSESERLDKHWYFALNKHSWHAPGEFAPKNHSSKSKTNYFIQFGAFKRKDSLLRFFKQNADFANQYTICYADDWRSAVIISNGYSSFEGVSNEYNRLTEKDYELAVIDRQSVNYWQCNYQISIHDQFAANLPSDSGISGE